MPLSFEVLELLGNIKELSISHTEIDAADLIELTQHLKETNVHTLKLRHNNLNDDDLSALVQYLKDTKVYTLDLSCNNIGIGNASASPLQHLRNTKIHTLNLSCNYIRDAGITALAQNLKDTNVQTIDLSHNYFEADGASELAQCLKDTKVHTINLSYNDIGNAGIKALEDNLLGSNVTIIDGIHLTEKLKLILIANREKPIVALADAAAKSSTLSQLPLEVLTEIVSYTTQSKHSSPSNRVSRAPEETSVMVLAESAFHAASEKILAQAIPLLDEYARSTTPKDTFFPGIREYAAEVKEIVKQIKDGSLNNKKSLVEELNKIKTKPSYKEESTLTMLIESIESLGVRVSHQY